MKKEDKTQVKIGVGIQDLWRALSKDLRFVLPGTIPNLVKDVTMIEGDGGLGSVFLFTFGSGVTSMRYQKEKIVELDEKVHQFGLQVIEGGHLDHGFSLYKTSFQLTQITNTETLVDLIVVYENQEKEEEKNDMPTNTTNSALVFIKSLEQYLLKKTDSLC